MDPAHAREQVLLRVACSVVMAGNTAEQTTQVIHHGYTRRRFPCHFPCVLECKSCASFNHEAMSSGDPVRPVISRNTVNGSVVAVGETTLHFSPGVLSTL